MATGIEITREDTDISEKKVELLDIPEQNIDTGRKLHLKHFIHNSIFQL